MKLDASMIQSWLQIVLEHSMSKASSLVIEALSDGRPKTTADLVALGASRVTLHRMALAGQIERAAHGVYRRPGSSNSPYQDWATLTVRTPKAVFCLASAAEFHHMTQDMPGGIEIAVPHEIGRVSGGMSDAFPTDVKVYHWRNKLSLSEGVETHEIDGVPVRITSPERTLVDFYRFSPLNIGVRHVSVTEETLVDALHRALDPQERIADPDKLLDIARSFGVEAGMRPLLVSFNFAVNNGYRS